MLLLVLKLLPIIFIVIIQGEFLHAQKVKQTESKESLNPKNIRIEYKSAEITIDGFLNEVVWNTLTPVSSFTQREPHEGAPVSEKTELRIFYDKDKIYFGIVCYDRTPEKIVANVLKRDATLENSDYFEIILDTFHDHRNGFYFATNPLGTKRDVLLRDEGNSLNEDWNGIWECKSKIGKFGWSSEIVIPFKTLRFRDGDEITWGANFGRMIARKREESYWTPILRSYGMWGKYKVSKFGHIEGLKNITHGSKFELRPYILGGAVKEYEQSDNTLDGDFNSGLDFKYRLTPNFTADFTYKTDFAQVEADLEQVNLTRFSLYYPEKRDFFLEGANIFRFGERFDPFDPGKNTLFFSRTIGITEDGEQIPVLGGARMTGKVSDYNVGFINMLTDEKTYYEDDNEKVTVPRTNYSVFRIKKDILSRSSIGFITTNKQEHSTGYYNRALGIDANFALHTNLQLGGFLAKTFTPGLEGKDYAGYFDFDYLSDFFIANFSYIDIGENFDSQMGFIKRTDIRRYKCAIGIGPRPGVLNIRQIFFGPELGEYSTDHTNRLLTRTIQPFMVIIFQDGSMLMMNFNDNYEYLTEEFEIRDDTVIREGIYKFRNLFAMFNTDQSKNVYFSGTMTSGQFFNGKILSFSFEPTVKPRYNFEINLRYARNILDLPVENGKFNTNIMGTRLTYSFTPDLYVKLFAQYNDMMETGTINFLLNYIYKPGMNFFLVYDEYYEDGSYKTGLKNRVLKAKLNYVLSF